MPPVAKPILLDFPDVIAETERLIIRAPRPGFGAIVHEAIVESFEQLNPWMHWAQTLQSVEDTERMCRLGAAQFTRREALRMHLFERESGRFIGSSSLNNIDWHVPTMEIGCWLRSSATGQGYATEAINAITDFAFATLGAERIEARCDAMNVRSAAVTKRCGFIHEGTLRCEDRNPQGELRDTLLFSKIRKEWRP